MRAEGPSWILVDGSDATAIRAAVISHSSIARHVRPQTHRVTIREMKGGPFAVTFEPPAPPYAFANLIGWLADSNMCRGSHGAVGWLVAPGDGTRYFLAVPRMSISGDRLLGVTVSGVGVTVFLPDCSVRRAPVQVEAMVEPEIPASVEPVESFEITLDGDASFGNPQFAVG